MIFDFLFYFLAVINKLFLIAVYGFGAAIKFIPALKGPGAPFLGLIFPNVLLVRAFEEAHILEIKCNFIHFSDNYFFFFFFWYEEIGVKFKFFIAIGVQWTNIFEIQDDYYKVTTFGLMMIFLVFGTIFHFTMSVYIQAIAPGKYGVKKNLLYFLEVIWNLYIEQINWSIIYGQLRLILKIRFSW